MNRSIPYFKIILKSPPKNRLAVMKSFPSFVMDDFIDILESIVYSRMVKDKKRKNTLVHIVSGRNKAQRRKRLIQKGNGIYEWLLPHAIYRAQKYFTNKYLGKLEEYINNKNVSLMYYMGNSPSLPNFSFNIKSDCCNGDRKDEEDMVRSRRASWFRRNIQSGKSGKSEQERDKKLVKRSTTVQSTSTDEETVPNKEISG